MAILKSNKEEFKAGWWGVTYWGTEGDLERKTELKKECPFGETTPTSWVSSSAEFSILVFMKTAYFSL